MVVKDDETLPNIVQVLGDALKKFKQAVFVPLLLPAKILADRLMLLLIVKLPPATAGDAVVVLIERTLVLISIVTVKLFAKTSSIVVGKADVFQTVVSDQFPFFVANTFGIHYKLNEAI
jgi:hypothetical protein